MFIYKNNNILAKTFPIGEFVNPIKVEFYVQRFDITNIKYIELP
jgi:hypothetical protein